LSLFFVFSASLIKNQTKILSFFLFVCFFSHLINHKPNKNCSSLFKFKILLFAFDSKQISFVVFHLKSHLKVIILIFARIRFFFSFLFFFSAVIGLVCLQ